jgi:hypothetical protein
MPSGNGHHPPEVDHTERRTRRCMTIRPDHSFRFFMFGFAALLGLVALFCVVLGLAGLAGSHAVAGAILLGVALVAGGLCWLVWTTSVHRRGPALTLQVCPDALTISRHGKVTDTVRRDEVGLVVIWEWTGLGLGPQGATRFDIYGPDRQLVGTWETNWQKSSVRSVRAFRRLGYPWVLHSQGPVVSTDKVRSKLAPPWTDEVLPG